MSSREILRALQSEKLSVEEAKRALITRESPRDTDTGTLPASALRGKEAIAIIGMSGRYPDARNLTEYWNNLVQGKNAIREIPPSRWDYADYYDPSPGQRGKIYSKWLGALDEIEYFDPLFFAISPAEADGMDPQGRIFLEEGYKAFEDAGYSPELLSNRKCGVYLGIMSHEYDLLLYQHKALVSTLGTSTAIAAARLAYVLNLKGPAIPIDTACSSSLVATHLACQALCNQEIDMALAGGVSLYLTPEVYMTMCQAEMLSPDGRCKAFDSRANGYVPGEGAGAIVLKRLQDAEADHDHIYGVIIGSGINQDGATNGIMAPSMKSQIELERGIYEKYQIDPASITYVEMHGTGTKLGDPIELEALATVFQEKTQRKQHCAIGSVKSNLGHTSAAAGMAGLHKVLLSMMHKKLVPSLNFQRPNPHFDFDASPFYVNTETRAWNRTSEGTALRAAVSSFGMSGTNAHLVVEEYVPARRDADRGKRSPYDSHAEGLSLFVLSARSEQQLKSYAQDMKHWIHTHEELALADIAFTLQLGRGAMDYRLAIVADSREVLLRRLEGFIENRALTGIYTGQTKRGLQSDADAQSLLHIWCQEKNLAKIAQVWVEGAKVDWMHLSTVGEDRLQDTTIQTSPTIGAVGTGPRACPMATMPHRISLPTYPFARERYWVSLSEDEPTGSHTAATVSPLGDHRTADPLWQTGQVLAEVRTEPVETGLAPVPTAPDQPSGRTVLHPLVQHNISDFFEQRFSSIFYGDEFFLADHEVLGQRMMPGVAYLEMARTAVSQAMRMPEASAGTTKDGLMLRLSQIAWARPLVIGKQPVEVHITLELLENQTIALTISSQTHEAEEPNLDVPFRGRDGSGNSTLPLESLHAQGLAELHRGEEVTLNVDLPAVQARCQRQISGTECYQRYRSLGISYGPTLQGIEQLYVGDGEVLARLRLPVRTGAAQGTPPTAPVCVPFPYVLHPGVLDAALHASIGLLIERNEHQELHLPFALEELSILGSMPTQGWSWVRQRPVGIVRDSDPGRGDDPTTGPVFDTEVCDDAGHVVLRLRGLSTRMLRETPALPDGQEIAAPMMEASLPQESLLRLVPLWKPVTLLHAAPLNPTNQVVIMGGTLKEQSTIMRLYPYAHTLEIPMGMSIERLAQHLQDSGTLADARGLVPTMQIPHVFWLAPHDPQFALTQESILATQQQGVLACFRLIKALLLLGYESQSLRWTVITRQARTLLTTETGDPTHAGLSGLFGSLAKEFSQWSIQLADLPADTPLPLAEMLRLPADPHGHGWLYRNEHWYYQTLVPLDAFTCERRPAYRRGGVYMVIGGASGIGQVWSEYVISKYQAQVIWLGRRKTDASIEAAQERLSTLGPRPHYITADATDRSALQQAYQETLRNFGQIHGVVHSAIVLLDQSLINMDEQHFQESLAAKVEVSVRLAQVFEYDALDFVLFFSSINAFTRNAGQSNYAAGCTFEDAFAARLGRDWRCRVKVMNWGYWGSVGRAATAEYRERMGQMGVGSIEPAEAMVALEDLLAGPVDQMALLKITKPATLEGALIESQESIRASSGRISSYIVSIPSSGLTKDIGTSGFPRAEVYTPNVNKPSENALDEEHKLVFVFSGQGSQWTNMGKQMLSQEAVFRTSLEECEEAMRPYTGWSLLEQLTAPESRSRLEEIAYLQPILFALQVALARLWISLEIRPYSIVGHSMGEIAAAHIAGVLSLSDAARIICLRSLLLRRLSGQGGMAVVELSLEQARQALVGKEAWVSVAVSNSPFATVLSGDPLVLRELLSTFDKQEISWRSIKSDVAGHSPQVDPLLEELRASLYGIKPQKASLPFYSTVTTKVVEGPECDETYWLHNLREPVLFSPVIQHLVADGAPSFLEISPHPLLLSAIQQCVPEESPPVIALPSLRRNEDERTVLLSTLRALYSAGYPAARQNGLLFSPLSGGAPLSG